MHIHSVTDSKNVLRMSSARTLINNSEKKMISFTLYKKMFQLEFWSDVEVQHDYNILSLKRFNSSIIVIIFIQSTKENIHV